MGKKVFVDGSSGTTGLKVYEMLARQPDIDILKIDAEKRRDLSERKKFLNAADIAILCLPDAASREAVGLIENPAVKVLDTSTAFRTDPAWAYGFPELGPAFREKIRYSHRVAVPGCHATGFISLVYPLVSGGLLPAGYPFVCQSISGYSGGGKKLIEKYETSRHPGDALESPQYYALSLQHKHLPEMQKICGLENPPVFSPVVGNFKQGLTVTVPLYEKSLRKIRADSLRRYYADFYRDAVFVRVMPDGGEGCLDGGYLGIQDLNGTNSLQIFVFHNEGRVLLVSRFDNLGKGASGAAMQCMNILLGRDERTGLQV